MKRIHFVKLLLVAVLATGSLFAWGETYQYVFSSKPSTGNNVSLSNVSWTISATSLNAYNNSYAGVQIGSKSSNGQITLTSSADWSYNGATKITEIRLWLNVGGTSITPKVTIGGKVATSDGTTVTKNSSAGSDWTKTTKVTFTPAADGSTGVVVIDVTSVKAGYICAMEIDCESSGSGETTDYFDVSFVDNVQGTDCSSFDMTHVAENTQIVFNSISDKPQATTGTCEQTHYHFVGWIEDEEIPNETGSNVIAAGTTSIKATKDVTYKAVWAQEAN